MLLTSRNESVAVRGDATYINFKPQCLTVEESWKLFQKIAFPRKDLSGKHSMKCFSFDHFDHDHINFEKYEI